MENVEVLYEGKWLRLCRKAGWEYVERTRVSGIVILVALTPAENILLVEQDRPALGARVVELPAGLAGDEAGKEKESLLEAARRELFEETGWVARSFTLLCEGPPSPGLSREQVSFLLAQGLQKKGPGGGVEGENLVCHEVALKNSERWLKQKQKNGALIDPKIYTGLYFLQSLKKTAT